VLELKETLNGVRLKLRVKAGGRRNALLGIHAGALKLTVTTAPEKGKANRAVLALLADTFGVPAASMEIISGATSPSKVVFVPLESKRILEKLSGLA
jgi:uncharacterized protein (TIGR00251 family)